MIAFGATADHFEEIRYRGYAYVVAEGCKARGEQSRDRVSSFVNSETVSQPIRPGLLRKTRLSRQERQKDKLGGTAIAHCTCC